MTFINAKKTNLPTNQWVHWDVDETLKTNSSARVFRIPKGSEASAAQAVRESGLDIVPFKIGHDSYVVAGRRLNPPSESLGIEAKDVVLKVNGKQGKMGTPLDRPDSAVAAVRNLCIRTFLVLGLPAWFLAHLAAVTAPGSALGLGAFAIFAPAVAGAYGLWQWNAKKNKSLDPKLFVPVAK